MHRTVLLLTLAMAACRTTSDRRELLVYVSNEDSGDVSVIDPGEDRVIATIPIGKRPRGLRLSPDGRTLLVAVSGSAKGGPGVDEATLPPPDRSADGIAVVDLERNEVTRVIESGPDPECFDLSPDGRRIYVSNEDSGRASVVDVATGAITATVAVGEEPEGVTTRPDGAVVYVTSEANNEVHVIDGAGRHLATIPTAARPRAIVFTADGKRALVTGENGGAIDWIDAELHRVIRQIPIEGEGARPMGVVLAPDGARAFVTNGRGRSVSILDLANGSVVRTIEDVGVRPWGIGILPDGSKLYTANGPGDDVSVIDVDTGAIIGRIPVGRSPWGVAVRSVSPGEE